MSRRRTVSTMPSREAAAKQTRTTASTSNCGGGFDFGDRVRFELIATAFNVFDQEQVTAVCGRLEGCAGVDFGLATSYRQPQSYEAGIRFEF